MQPPDGGDEHLHEVRLLRLPVPVWQRTQEHVDELLREFMLITQDPESAHGTPHRLLELIDRLTVDYAGFSAEQDRQLAGAADRGEQELDLVYLVPVQVADAARELGDLLDEADGYCRAGEHLLTLASPQEAVRFRHWYLDQFVEQPAGAAPVAWPDYPA